MLHVGGVVLCGGRSTRMGVAKAWLPFGPETMLQRVVRLLGEVVRPIVVVHAAGQELPPLPADVLLATDRREAQGPLEGLAAGFAALPESVDAAYATSCDVPLLVPAFVQAVVERLGEHDIAVPYDGEYHHPLAAVYRSSVRDHVDRLLAANRLRPVFLFEECYTLRVPVQELRSIDPTLGTLANLNHPNDYFAALTATGFTAPPETVAALAAAAASR